jgi:hypothetical protein
MNIETKLKWLLAIWDISWLRNWVLRLTGKSVVNKLQKERSSIMSLTPNTNVSELEKLGFSVGDLLYATKLRDLLIKAIDSPDKMYDDRLLAAADGAFGYKQD